MTTPPLVPYRLRCAHLAEPLSVAADRVRFSWLLAGTGHDRRQLGYQVQVAATTAGQPAASQLASGDQLCWDSGQVPSSSSVDIDYAGTTLMRGGCYAWAVRVWDESGTASPWSEPARFGVELDPGDGWHACWIGLGPIRDTSGPPSEPGPPDPVARAMRPPPYFRRSFGLTKPVASARLRITALGLYEARLNGQRVADAFLTPGWTDYGKRVLYQTYEVSGLLAPGENVLAAVAADGWYCGYVGLDAKRAGAHYGASPELLAQLDVTFDDGCTQRIVTDESWRGRLAAIRHADLLMGERQDRGLEPYGWDRPGFDESGWRPVRCRQRDARELTADPGPPVRVIEQLAPVSIRADADGRQIADFGQNLTGWLRIRIDAPSGTRVRIRHGEVLAADGSLYTENLRSARQADEFITADGPQVLEPRFTLHGFRYAEITGCPAKLDDGDVTARVVHSDIPRAGWFSSSAGWLDRLHSCIDWGQRGNFVSIPTDCPQRDERLGWLGDAQVFARTACYNRDVASFYVKWLDDVADAQLGSGAYADIAPTLGNASAGTPAWADAGVIVPWTVWKMYGDTAILRRHLDSMTAWMDLLHRANPDYLRSRDLGNSYNDWLAPGSDDTPPELLATAYWAHDTALMAEICETVGRAEAAARYRELWSNIRDAFSRAFVRSDGSVESGTQTSYVLALHMGLVPDDKRGMTADRLVAAIEAAGWQLTTGFVGVSYLLPALSSTGHSAVAYRLLEQRACPSWRYMIDNGATTIWERWDGWTRERGFQSAWMNSFNHYALGSVGEWLYRFVLGIDQQPGTAGFSHPLLRPHPGGSLGWARGSYQSARGTITAGWRRDGDTFSYHVELPPNVTATVCVPAADGQGAVFHVGSGSHDFTGSPLAAGFR